MSFTSKTPEFIFENHAKDSKEWFREHKADYEQYIKAPFKEFLELIEPFIHKIDPELSCDPKQISRLYRDARYAKGQSVFRDYVWYTFCRKRRTIPRHPHCISAYRQADLTMAAAITTLPLPPLRR